MRGDRKAMEDKVAELTESYAASKTSWDKEVKQKLLFYGGGEKISFSFKKELSSLVFTLIL